jgi:hypothetical protein
VIDNILYAGGTFTAIGPVTASVSANRIAVCDLNTVTWAALGAGLSGGALPNCKALVYNNTNSSLYAAGSFTTAGAITVNNIARWSGVTWVAMSQGVNDFCNALALDETNGKLYVGGAFTASTGGTTLSRFGEWNISSLSWVNIGSNLNGNCNAIYLANNTVYIGGAFTSAGGSSVSRLASYNLIGTASVLTTPTLKITSVTASATTPPSGFYPLYYNPTTGELCYVTP